MSFLDCINGNKLLTPKQKKELANEYDALTKQYKSTMGDVDAAMSAAQKIVEVKSSQIAKKKLNTMKDVLAWKALNEKLDVDSAKYKKLRTSNIVSKRLYGNNDVATAVREVLENTYTRTQAIERRATNAIFEQIEKYRTKMAGLTQDAEGFKNVVKELHGKDTGNATSKSDAKAIREVFDYLHRMYENVGGVIGKIENYFPQSHNSNLVKRAGFEQWKSFISDKIDLNKMTNPDTGLPFNPRELDAMMPKIYEDIITNGLNDVALRAKEGKQTFGRGGGVAMRHSSSRFFHFKDGDSFLDYNAKFGYGDAGLFDAMMGHISTMSRDIGIMQELGTNPDAQVTRMKMKLSSNVDAPLGEQTIQGMYDTLAGRNSYNGELPVWYQATSALQNWLRSSLLGSAPVAAMTDSFYSVFASKINGIPATKTMAFYFKQLNPLDASDRRTARRIGLMVGAANGRSLKATRFADDADNRGVTGFMASFTNRASGLGVMTDSARSSLILSTQGYLAELKHTNTSFADLPDGMKEAFQRWDINETDYNNFKQADFFVDPDTEGDFIRPEEIAKVSVESARKLEMWMMDMSQAASNEPRLLTRAITTGAIFGQAKTGTGLRATASSLMMFKSFGISVILNHFLPTARRLADPSKGADKYGRAAALVFVSTILGAAAIQGRDFVNGKTPRDMNDWKFWQSAALQGGGFGIFGDFLFSDQSRFGNTIIETVAGPVAGTLADLMKVFKGNFDKALDEGTETKFFADAYQMAERNIPMVKLWYTRLFLERFVLDHAERAIDPNFDARMRRIENKAKTEKGQEFWWKP